MKTSSSRVALRWKLAFDSAGMTPEELEEMARFLTTQVDGMDDKSICFGSYATVSLPPASQSLVKSLRTKLILSYRKRLVAWFEHALKKRANLGGGGPVIRKIELGLAEFVKAIPDAVLTFQPIKLSKFVPPGRYLDTTKIDPVANKIVSVVRAEAEKVGVILNPGSTRLADMPFSVKYDPAANAWFIPEWNTFPYKEKIKGFGFWWRPQRKRWEINSLTSQVRKEFKVHEAPGEKIVVPSDALPKATPGENLRRLQDWFFNTWYPKNTGRFTKVFTDFARNPQSSYTFTFEHRGTSPVVTLERDLQTPAQIVEELRYRYIGHQGREPWLEVLEKFVQLVDTTNPDKLISLIDRINNLQHSNGLFMEHFPSDVKSWYEQFLNAKYHSPTVSDLARYIPDQDLKSLILELARPMTPSPESYEPPPAYHLMVKKLEEGDKVNWRQLGYPLYPGAEQVNRFAPEVQKGLDTLKKLDTEREKILSTRVTTEKEYENWQGRVVRHVQQTEEVLESIENDVEQGLREMKKPDYDDPDFAATWAYLHDTKNFLEDFPTATRSELAWFRARYGASTSGE